MKRLLLLLAMLLCAFPCYGQSVSLTGTVTDSGGQTWNNGTITFTFSGGQPPYTWTGGALNIQTPITGTLSATGTYSVSVPDNSQIFPGGSQWKVTACPATSLPPSGCYITYQTITVANTVLNLTPPALSFKVPLTPSSVPPVIAYADAEISGSWVGFRYYNLTTQSVRVCQAMSAGNCSTWTGNATQGGVNNFKTLNGIQFADQYTTTSAVGNPVTLANITGSATGGTVAANTYACEVTYNGATSGETQASPTSGTIVMSGSTNQLACAPGDVQTGTLPAGALTYNVYWQTGGSGSYFAGHTSVAFTTTDVQTTTPATTGANPPVNNTAVGILPTAQTALGGNAGTLVIPTTEPANSGWPGTPLTGQTILDQRNGVFLSNTKSDIPNQIVGNDTSVFTNNQPNPLLSLNLNGVNFEAEWHATQFSTNTQFAPYNAVQQIGYKTTAGSTVFGMLGLGIFADTFNPGQGSGGSNSVALYVQNRCNATNCHIWGMNPLVIEQSGFRPEYANTIEADYNNNSGTDATAGQALIEDGINVISGGTNKPRQAVTVVANIAADYWQEGIVDQNFQTNGVRIQGGASGSAAEYIVPPDNTGANEILGRNAANSSNNWFVQNVGTAQFAILAALNWIQDNSGCTVGGAGFIRICSVDQIVWENNAGNANVVLAKTGAVSGTIPADTLDTSGFGGVKVSNIVATSLLASVTAPTIAAAGCGGAAASISNNNGTAAFEVNVGTTPGSACTITMPAAAHKWICTATDFTTNSTSVFLQKQSPVASQTTTQIVITNFSDVAAATAFVASDIMGVSCHAY